MRLPLPQFASQAHQPNHIAEVIETSTVEFLAQCLEPDSLSFAQMPPFGSWVKAADEDSGNQIFGVVYHATTSPLDSVHRATALGLSLAELREQQPQIFAMLKTEFRVAIAGFQPAGDTIFYQHLPPRPPQVHQAVYTCEADDIIAFTEQLDFIRTLMDMRSAPVDGLIAAVIRQVYQLRKLDRDWLVQTGRVLNVLLKDDYDRLRIILSQIHP
ncbi:HAS-barrel domain-containing protein [Oscillatoria sp. CS-180]|uniref:HAS-barrel domain-containing protein n=1 Tax=Oscillatoria sp. CS-180 TaxID=3021720 RepID=UPI00232E7EBC|nr:HAS-barrel domain-containing protein [Oscillatoria sp. CS-180]MDB9528394.1 HAS-barrel domain-containing protein [Oscillatoria sp. CS-180]